MYLSISGKFSALCKKGSPARNGWVINRLKKWRGSPRPLESLECGVMFCFGRIGWVTNRLKKLQGSRRPLESGATLLLWSCSVGDESLQEVAGLATAA